MKLRKLIDHLKKHGVKLMREGGNHSVYFNPSTELYSTVPRHKEINDELAFRICKQLGIPKPK